MGLGIPPGIPVAFLGVGWLELHLLLGKIIDAGFAKRIYDLTLPTRYGIVWGILTGQAFRRQNPESNRVKKILIIEDHADMRELLSWQVELMGFAALVAKQARDGIEKALAEKPELIVLDIMMPGMDGWQAARELRAHLGSVAEEAITKAGPRTRAR